jgi:D-erythronate 2-dehydrogenase
MRILVIGAAGMVGRKFIERLAEDGQIGGKPINHLLAHDVVMPKPPKAAFPIDCVAFDFAMPGACEKLVATRPDLIVHLAAIVSGEAETDFDKGYRINLDGTRYLLEAIRKTGDGYKPKLIFSSSIAVFGAPFPETIPGEFFSTPLTSYGTQKAIDELLLADYTRRGFLDGVGLRFPTIVVRPGAPNKAASSFFSNILREPLSGKEAVLPVDDHVRHWFASPRAAVGYLLHAASMDLGTIGQRRNLSMPGLSGTIGAMLEALRLIAGEKAVKLIRREPDAFISRIVGGWATNFDASRAEALGFTAEKDFGAIIRAHIEDELGGKIGP